MFLADWMVPIAGDVSPGDAQDTNIGIEAGTWKLADFDQTVFTSSSSDLSVSANQTNYEYSVLTTRSTAIEKNHVMEISQVKMNTTANLYSDFGVSKVKFEMGPISWTVYDYNGGIDYINAYQSSTIGKQFDSNLYSSFKNDLKSVKWTQDEVPAFRFKVTANSRDTATWATGYLADGNITLSASIYDVEGTALLDIEQLSA